MRKAGVPKNKRIQAGGKIALMLLMWLVVINRGWHLPRVVPICLFAATALLGFWEMFVDFRRMRPRGRMRMMTAIFGGLAGAFALMAVAALDDKNSGWEWMAGGFITLCAVCTAGSVWSCVRMRRLCGEVRQRLWELRKIRRRRAIAAGREVYR